MKKVEVVTTIIRDEEDPRARVEVFVDGARVVRGRIGGEPEDNSIVRDYDWVDTGFAALAKALGADVTERTVRNTDE